MAVIRTFPLLLLILLSGCGALLADTGEFNGENGMDRHERNHNRKFGHGGRKHGHGGDNSYGDTIDQGADTGDHLGPPSNFGAGLNGGGASEPDAGISQGSGMVASPPQDVGDASHHDPGLAAAGTHPMSGGRSGMDSTSGSGDGPSGDNSEQDPLTDSGPERGSGAGSGMDDGSDSGDGSNNGGNLRANQGSGLQLTAGNTQRDAFQRGRPVGNGNNRAGGSSTQAGSNSGGSCDDAWVLNALEAHNNLRGSPLSCNTRASAVSTKHSQTQCSQDSLTHNGFDSRCSQAVFGSSCGENVLYNYDTSSSAGQKATKEWEQSPPHLANIKDPNFKQVGFGWYICGNGKVFWTALFG